MARTRHVGLASLGAQSVILSASTAFCETFDPANPITLVQAGVLAFTAVLTAVDWKKNNGKN